MSELLFDVGPMEPAKTRAARARLPVPPSEPKPEPEKSPIYIRATVPKPIGTLDEGHVCIDQTCQGTAFDIEDEGIQEIPPSNKPRPAWLIRCCFCGTGQWVAVIPGHLEPKEEGFVFHDGRFAGMSIDEAVEQPRGRDYVEWAAKEHKRPAVRTACQTYLDLLQTDK